MIKTELQNKNTVNMDLLAPRALVDIINKEDGAALRAVAAAKKEIARAVEKAAKIFAAGGNIIFIGAGTSGRLGVIEAAECYPTFSLEPGRVLGITAGGKNAVFKSKEGAEDDGEQGKKDILKAAKKGDIVFGVTASGRTPYVISALRAAGKIGAATVLICCNNVDIDKRAADIIIYLPTGPEVLQGSTRMKAGTATKMTLNIITTSTMALCGKIYKNLMVDVKATNNKLRGRAARLVRSIAGVDEKTAQQFLRQTNYNVKTAVVMLKKSVDKKTAGNRLQKQKGFLRKVLNE
ncbi:MAG: N-acetylmuramic acid 6-phosphate etherase [Elusimicrobium sp.]|jgi:N-acetylmuramic acid 6-phosphate etherase|nr:N-acetylmuramic acid 6-phosphate etherase [Elusimicrobium sp.]